MNSIQLKDGFVLRKIAGQSMAIPVGARTQEIHGMIGLNETGAFLWTKLQEAQTEDGLTEALLEEYEVEEQLARESVRMFLDKLGNAGFLKQRNE